MVLPSETSEDGEGLLLVCQLFDGLVDRICDRQLDMIQCQLYPDLRVPEVEEQVEVFKQQLQRTE